MGTVASTNAGLTNLLQTLSSVGSPLTSTLSTPALQSALQHASPADIVKLSDAALQLQATDQMFGVSNTSDPTNLLSALESSAAGSTTTPSSSSGSAADRLAAAESDLQAQQVAALFGTNNVSTATTSLFNVVG